MVKYLSIWIILVTATGTALGQTAADSDMRPRVGLGMPRELPPEMLPLLTLPAPPGDQPPAPPPMVMWRSHTCVTAPPGWPCIAPDVVEYTTLPRIENT